MQEGDILGHEFMGEVVSVGSAVENLRPGDRVVVPFAISCGRCFFCQREQWALCDNSNPSAGLAAAVYGFSGAGLFGYSHMMGGYAGGQAQMVRVPFADVGPLKLPPAIRDEQALFLSDIFPTGYMAAENCQIQPGDVVAVWGCGPVGQFAIRSAWLLGAEKVIAIDREPARLSMAAASGADVVDFGTEHVTGRLTEMTGGRGPDACIDCVGRPTALRQAVKACRKGGVVSIPGVYGGFVDKLPLGAAFAKGLTFKMGQAHVQRYLRPLLKLIEDGKIDPSFVITHRVPLEFAPEAFEMFKHKRDGCVKIVLTP
jgi:threonine dehydrogenase-like Zn-dependent dehydrogenase